MTLSNVDRDWYLANYPDVKTSGMDPEIHYQAFGKAEGRYPRQLKTMLLEKKLWGGFSELAQIDLKSICINDYEDSLERLNAHWVLASWHASYARWIEAEHHLEFLQGQLPSFIEKPNLALLKIEIYFNLKKLEKAETVLERALILHGPANDLLLSAANLVRPEFGIKNKSQLFQINKIFVKNSLFPITEIDPQKNLALNNITTKTKFNSTIDFNEKVSIIMPAYNASSTIRTAINSILHQSWQNLEVIVIDDCSDDDTVKIVNEIIRTDERVRLIINKKNEGAYSSRNTGLKFTTGKYISNHDSDDWSHSQKIEKLVLHLQSNNHLIGCYCDWVRVTSDLHFTTWNFNQGLIEPSISTLLFKREALDTLGGWDNVRVAADSEFHERLLKVFGKESVAEVYPGTPLVFAQHWEGSLTNTHSTHARTVYSGIRKDYSCIARIWREMASPSGLKLEKLNTGRTFPCPDSMRLHPQPHKNYDYVLIGDFSDENKNYLEILKFVEALISYQQKEIGLFHWPRYKLSTIPPISDFFLHRAIETQLDIIFGTSVITTQYVKILGLEILEFPPDELPNIKYSQCEIIDIKNTKHLPVLNEISQKKFGANILSDIYNSGLFDAQWYLSQNTDVFASGIDPLYHYLTYGWLEGREPNSKFNSDFYSLQLPQVIESRLPPLIHFIKCGAKLGYKADNPEIFGDMEYRPQANSILICGHASGEKIYGAERCLVDLVRSLSRLTYNVIVSIPSIKNPEYINTLKKYSCSIHITPCTWWSTSVNPSESLVSNYEKIIARYSIKCVHANTIMLREPIIAAKSRKIPSIIHVHEIVDHDLELCNSIGLSAKEIRNSVSSLADRIVSNSKFTASYFGKAHKNYIISNTVDEDLLELNLDYTVDVVQVSLISSNTPKKGLQDLLDIAEILSNDKHIQFNIIGPVNSFTKEIQRSISDRKLGNIKIIDYLKNPIDAIKLSHVVLNLSNCQETFGRTILEAMAGARPVLAYDFGALPEIVQNGINGYLVPLRSTRMMAEKLKTMCEHRENLFKMGVAGRNIFLERNSHEAVFKQIKFIYSDILKNSKKTHTKRIK